MSTGTILPNSCQSRPEDRDKLLKQLLEYVQRCQRRYGGKKELATEFDACIAGLCLCLEAVFLHGLKTKPNSNQNQTNSTLKQVSDIVAQSLNLRQESISFWLFIEKHLTNHERERFNILKNIWTDIGRCKAWVRAVLNEKSLERYFHIILSDKHILEEHYESWSLLRDEDRNSMLPNMAAGLGSILFAISIDKLEFNTSIAPRPVLSRYQDEPLIEVPIPDNKEKKDKNKRKVARQIISFDDDDSMLSTSVPSISSSSTCSDSSSLGHQYRSNYNSQPIMEHRQLANTQSEDNYIHSSSSTGHTAIGHNSGKPQSHDVGANMTPTNKNKEGDRPRITRKLSMENSGSRTKFSSNVPETLTPINQSSIGELTPVSVERIRDFDESPDTSDDILEVPTDISAVLTVVENKNLEEIRRRDERIKLLAKENDTLKEQIKKYVGAIQMLRGDYVALKNNLDEELHIDSQQPDQEPDYRGEAKLYEQKLVQVADMHAELMDFNVMLQKSLLLKDASLDRLKNELQELRGPMSSDDLDDADDDSRSCVNVWIPSAFLTGSGSNSHHVYQLFLKAGNDEWNIYRRYAQFHALHSDLKKLDPAVRTFDFPPKKSLGKKDSALVEVRRKRLQIYLRKVIAHWPELAHCGSRFLLEQHLAFFKDQQENEVKKNIFSSRRSGSSGNYSGL